MLSHWRANNFKIVRRRSQSVSMEKPRNSPRDPPASARNDMKGYRYVSSFTVKLLLENPDMKPRAPVLSALYSIS